jgi:hypothetical protein
MYHRLNIPQQSQFVLSSFYVVHNLQPQTKIPEEYPLWNSAVVPDETPRPAGSFH